MDDDSSVAGGKEDGGFRMDRRRFVGTGLAAAGAALVPAGVAKAKPGGAETEAARQAVPATGGEIGQLPLRGIYPNLPAIPVDEAGMKDTLTRLQGREQQELQAKQGLTQKLTLGGRRRTAYAFLFEQATPATQTGDGQELEGVLQDNPDGTTAHIQEGLDDGTQAPIPGGPLSLEEPEQFSISWTHFPDVYDSAQDLLPTYTASLTDADSATEQFWPMIAEHGFGYNLIIPERVDRARARELRGQFGSAWNRKVRSALAAGNLYVIDMSRFETLEADTVSGAPRFTPATVTLLTRSARTKSLTPVAIIVSGQGGQGRRVYARSSASDGAWLYALQAAKASVTLFGVWLGHVYHWHIVTAAMQMAMFNTLPSEHPVYRLLAPQSKFAIPFDGVLLALWSGVAPPTALTTAEQFLALANDYATDREYFDDDPKTTLSQLGLRQKDFTNKTAWDRYPVVGRLLTIWDLVEEYVETFVATSYGSDAEVAADQDLQAWIATAGSSDPDAGGNVRGLPETTTRAALQSVLTSMLYRITVHGISRLNSTSNPALTFTANFPHCLQRTDIPSPRDNVSTRALLRYLPNTHTISQAVTFYFTFAYSTPYEPFIPLGGVAQDLFFPGGGDDPRNGALIELRRGLRSFIADYQPDLPQPFQWPRNIET